MIPQSQISELANYSGSFWRTHLHPESRELFRRLRETYLEGAATLSLNTTLAGLGGDVGLGGGLWHPYNAESVVVTHSGYNRWQRTRVNAQWSITHSDAGAGSSFLSEQLTPSYHAFVPHNFTDDTPAEAPTWLVPIPEGVHPLAIAGTRWLVAGIDFSVQPGYIEVFQNPDELFGPAGMVLLRARITIKNPTGFAFSSDSRANANVARYYRHLQTPDTLLRAALSAAGFIEVTETCTVLAVTLTGYLTDKGRVEVGYDHTPLDVGTVLAAGTFIGASPELVAIPDLLPTDFPDGFNLGNLTPWDLRIPTGAIHIDIVAGHARPRLIGDESELTAFWGALAQAETLNPAYTIAGTRGWSDGPHVIDWLDMLRENEIGRHVWIVRLNAPDASIEMVDRLKTFLKRERPLGKAVVFTGPEPLPLATAKIAKFFLQIIGQTDNNTAGLTPMAANRDVFSSVNLTGQHSFVRNEDLWGNSYFSQYATGVAAWKAYTGQSAGGVTFTDQHLLFCGHYFPGWGVNSTVEFVTQSGAIVVRTIIASIDLRYVPNGRDLAVCLLNAPLPPDIHIFRIFPKLTIPQKNLALQLKVPDTVFSQGGATRGVGWDYSTTPPPPQTNNQMVYPGVAYTWYGQIPPLPRRNWFHYPFPGDSGTPRFISHPSEMCLYEITSGASVSENLPLIEWAMLQIEGDAINRGTLVGYTGKHPTVSDIVVPLYDLL
jgi:hypothetical protein